MIKMIKELVLSIAIAWLFGKVLKTIIDWVKEKKISLKVLFYDGGMPSLHTIAVVSLATGLFLETGFSYWFVISVILALIVINDALNVRWITQNQSKAINKLIMDKPGFKKLSEHVGHKPVDVLVGLVIGIVIPVIVYAIL
ncbi:divergent PAP2 family protein [Candidatus Woesearchaeota archaeon]|nr:divergent PAP2 family protein [Candidatus Woesearchaeota archaeon]